MTKLTANTHGYEFELMPNVIVQYDANEIGGMIAVDSFVVAVITSDVDLSFDAALKLHNQYDDVGIIKEIQKHFRSIN